jgi:fructose-1,6-bisphosphatase/inositol monophosphatase family enzyme
VDTEAVLALIREVADEVVVPRFRDLDDDQVGEKGPGDLVTIADHEAEELLTRALSSAYPAAVMLGEEATARDDRLLERYLAADHAFTIDPIDGTKNFVKGSKDHAVMIAEVRAGVTVRSWIWQPQHHTAYVAELGAGAWHGDTRLTRPPPGDPLRGVTSRRAWIGRALGALRPMELTWVCCGVDYPRLVEGEADYALYSRSNPWDHAPGALLLTEAGGHVGDFDGSAYRPQAEPPSGLVVAADRATYDLVSGLLPGLR